MNRMYGAGKNWLTSSVYRGNGVMTDSIAQLITLLDSSDRHARAVAAIELGKLKVADVLPRLRAMVDDEDDIVAFAGMYACWLLGEDRVSMERMVSALDSEDEEVVQMVAQIVTEMGEFLIPKLDTTITQSPGLTIHALNLLEEIGGPSALAVIKAVKSDDPEVIELINEIVDDWDYDSPGEIN